MSIDRDYNPETRSLELDRSRSRFAIGLVWLVAMMAWFVGPAQVLAQSPPPLDIDIERMYPVRSEGPITLRVRMTPRESTMLKGHLEFRLYDEDDLLSTLVTGEEFINPPSKTARYVLPSPGYAYHLPQLDLQVDFVTEQGRRFKFDPHALNMPHYREREFVIAIVEPPNKTTSSELDTLTKGLKLENFTPAGNDQKQIDSTLHTILTTVAPDQLPPDATGYCGFNMVFIAAEGLAAFRESQWTPLLDWVEAGGSLCLMPGEHLTSQQVAALNRLVQHREDKQTFVLDPNNDLIVKDADENRREILLRRGLGRIAIVPLRSNEPLDANSLAWRTIVAHLWNIRFDQRNYLAVTGQWAEAVLDQQDLDNMAAQSQYRYYQTVRDKHRRLSYAPIYSGDRMTQSIMPSNLRVIPISLIAFILLMYVLAIGPVDYFVLGRLKLRKWTWVTFPVTTLLFAGGALWMAEWYMNTGDARRSVYFVDIGVEGNVERVTQFEMLFNSRQKLVETPLKKSLFSPLNHQDYGGAAFQSYYRPREMGGISGSNKPQYHGRVPSNFVVRQLTPKWVPQMNRMTSIVPSVSDPSEVEADAEDAPWARVRFDWQQFQRDGASDWPKLVSDTEWKQSLVEPIRAAFPNRDLVIGLFAGGQYVQLHGTYPLFQNPNEDESNSYNGRPRPTTPATGRPSDFLSDVSMRRDGGLFGVVSSVAPHGGRQLEDLSLVDPSDPRQWLLVVGVSDGENWIVYRKLYAGIE